MSKPEVQTKVGVVRGLTSDDGTYDMFLGIPYGKVDKNNPFGLSYPYPPFEIPFEANSDTAASPQLEEFNNTIIGSLDCLHVNIYVPKCAKNAPVLVHLHGGRFEIGFSGRYFYGPKYFMKQNIILITFNYRLGPYGLMCLDTAEVPGNQGLRDALMALRWIKNNIEGFGGDAGNITLCGHSAGAIIIGLFLTLEDEVFHKAIQMSGTIIRPGVIRKADKTYPIKLAAELGFTTSDAKKALEFLNNVDPKLVIEAHVKISEQFYPCIENKHDGVERIIRDNSENLLKSNLRKVPIMIGNATSEAMVLYYKKTAKELKEMNIFNAGLKRAFNFDDDTQRELEDVTKKFYLGDKDYNEDVMWDLTNFYSDLNFVYPVQRTITEYVKQGFKVYHYNFSYNGKRNFIKKKFNMVGGGTSHADDLTYLFDVSFEKETTDEDQLMIDRLTTMWANFAKYGNPIPATSDLLPTKWRPVTDDAMYYLDIGADLKLGKRPIYERMAFWELFYKSYENDIK